MIRKRAGGRRAARCRSDATNADSRLGHVTSTYMSPTLGRSIALAWYRMERDRLGKHLFAPMADHAIGVRVCFAGVS